MDVTAPGVEPANGSGGQQASVPGSKAVDMHTISQVGMPAGTQVDMQSGELASMQTTLEAEKQGSQWVGEPTSKQLKKAAGKQARREELKQLSEKLLEVALPDGAGLGKYTTYMMPEHYLALQRLKLELQALAPKKGDKDDPRKRGIDVAALLRHAMIQTYGHLLDLD